MGTNDVDEKIIHWNDIFDQMVIDVETLVKDFSGMINFPIPLAILMFAIGGGSFVGTILLSTDLLVIVYVFFLMCCLIISGLLILRYWHAMKTRYDRLFAMQKALEST